MLIVIYLCLHLVYILIADIKCVDVDCDLPVFGIMCIYNA